MKEIIKLTPEYRVVKELHIRPASQSVGYRFYPEYRGWFFWKRYKNYWYGPSGRATGSHVGYDTFEEAVGHLIEYERFFNEDDIDTSSRTSEWRVHAVTFGTAPETEQLETTAATPTQEDEHRRIKI
jgi:hypothetical protein